MTYEPYMTAKELAAYLKLNPQTVYRKAKKKGEDKLPSVRIGRSIRFNKNDINNWLNKNSNNGGVKWKSLTSCQS
jgi:excisionase family DNA binding protein